MVSMSWAIALLNVLTVGGPTVPPQNPPVPPASQSKSTTCEVESAGKRLKTSSGGLVRVAEQIQMCDQGKWILDPTLPLDPKDAKAKSCFDSEKQEFASGVLRETAKGLERCSDGKWVPRK